MGGGEGAAGGGDVQKENENNTSRALNMSTRPPTGAGAHLGENGARFDAEALAHIGHGPCQHLCLVQRLHEGGLADLDVEHKCREALRGRRRRGPYLSV